MLLGLSCDSALTLSSVIWPPPAPGAVGLETFRGRGWRREGVRGCGGRGCVRPGVRPSVMLRWLWLWVWARGDPSPFMPAPVCRSVWGLPVAGNQPQYATGCFGAWGEGDKGLPCCFRLGKEALLLYPKPFWHRLLLRTGSFLPRRRRKVAVAGVLPQECWAELAWAAGGGCSVPSAVHFLT